MLTDWIRRTGFWTLDAMRGGEIKQHYADVKARNTLGFPNVEQLEQLLQWSVEQTEFYKDCNAADFGSFPIINKNDIKTRWDDMHAKALLGKPVHYMATSGSTGTPFTMEWDMNKRKRQLAELVYFNELADQKLGQPYIYFRVWTEKNRKSKRELWMQNLTPINILHLDDATLEEIRQRLKKRPYINSCLAYASTYEYLVRYLRQKGDTPDMFHTKTFVSGSEVLGMEMKQMIKETVGCKVIDRYSNEENGFLAQSEDCSDRFKVNIASFKIEILKQDCDEPAEIGEVGRIVVTDLYSFAVPLIRYDTGDLAMKAAEKDGWVTELKTIQGRRVDVIYDTRGNVLSPIAVCNYMWGFNGIKQYQFIQEDAKEYVLKVNGAKGVYTDEELIKHLKSILGDDANVTIEHVDGIPALASGKFKKTVCNYTPK